MMSQKVGGYIAEARAVIAYYKYTRDTVAAELQALKHFHSVISQSKRYKKGSYENVMLLRQIENKELELEAIKEMLQTAKENLNEYLKQKEEFRNKLRTLRKDKT